MVMSSSARGSGDFPAKSPSFFVEQAAVHRNQWIILQGAPQIQYADDGLFSSAVLAGDHHGSTAAADAVDVILKIADGPRKAEDAAVKAASVSGLVENRMPAWLGDRGICVQRRKMLCGRGCLRWRAGTGWNRAYRPDSG